MKNKKLAVFLIGLLTVSSSYVCTAQEMDEQLNNSPYMEFDTYDTYPYDYHMMYTGHTFDGQSVTAANLNVIKEPENENNQVLKIETIAHEKKNASDVSSAIILSTMGLQTGDYIIENDFKMFDEDSKLRFHMRGSTSREIEDIARVEGGALYLGATEQKLADVSFNEWHTLSIFINTVSCSYELMLNNEKVGFGQFSVLNTSILTGAEASMRMTFSAPAEIAAKVYLDNYKLYKGKELLSNEYLETLRPPVFDTQRAEGPKTQKLKGAVVIALDTPLAKVFSENSTIYRDNTNAVPYKSGNTVMVPLRFLAEAYGYTVSGTVDGNIILQKDGSSVDINPDSGLLNKNGEESKLSKGVELKYDRSFVAAEDMAKLLSQKLQLTDNGLIIFSDSEEFYNTADNAFEIEMLAKLFKEQKSGPRVFTEVDDAFFEKMRAKIDSKKQPYKSSWDQTKDNADYALATNHDIVLFGYTDAFYNTAIKAGGAVRDLSFVWRVTGEEKYAIRAKELLMQWVRAENPFPVYKANTDGAISEANGLTLSRAMTAYLYGYSFLYPYLSESECREVEKWTQRIAAGVKYTDDIWRAHDYHGKQYYQNHIMIHAMGMTVSGLIAKDLDLLYYVLEDPNNDRKMTDMIRGVIVMEGDDEICIGDPTLTQGKPAPQDGEIYDRYRMRVNKGLQYAELCSRALFLTAEMLYNNGVDYYDYYAENGENIRLPFEFYADFHLTLDASIKGGYYTGTALLPRYHAIYPMVQARYPESYEIQNVCLNVEELVQTDGEQVGYLSALTHGEEVPHLTKRELPVINKILVNGKEFDEFRGDKTVYEIDFTPSESQELEVEIDTAAYAQKMPSDKSDSVQYLVYDKQNPNIRGAYKFIGKLVADTDLPENAVRIPCKAIDASDEEVGNEMAGATDDSDTTRWCSYNDQWILFEMEEKAEISLVTMMFYKAIGRRYIFNIEVSEDGNTWNKVFDSTSSGKTEGREVFRFSPVMAKYIRVNMSGYVGSNINNINDFRVYTQNQ